MKHHYIISGMHCNHCVQSTKEALEAIGGIRSANVSLVPPEVEVVMDDHVAIEAMNSALAAAGNYQLLAADTDPELIQDANVVKQPVRFGDLTGKFYCPMLCEGDKMYDGPGDCPVCGMDLVPAQADAESESENYRQLLKKFWVALLFTVPIFLIAMAEMLPENPLEGITSKKNWYWIEFILSLPVVFYATRMFFERAYNSIVHWNLNMFTLIGMGAGVAFLFSCIALLFPNVFPDQFKTENGNVFVYFEAVTVILTLVLMGQLLEARAHSRTNNAIKELLKLVPAEAIHIEDGVEKRILVEDVLHNYLLRIKPGDRIPVDGQVVEGNSTVDESMITGEPIPIEKSESDTVSAGTINGHRSMVIKAEKIGSETLLSHIIQMVNDASRSKAPIQHLADKVSGYFVPVVVAVAIITFVIWALVGPHPALVYAFVNGIAVMIIACPCALGLATPMSVMVGVGKGAQSGVLIKNAAALERLNDVDTLIIDKTGTITEGRPSVERMDSIEGFEMRLMVQMIRSLNQLSEHPLAQATVDYAIQQKIELLAVSDFEAVVGKGVVGTINNKAVAVGNRSLMVQTGTDISVLLELKVYEERQLGKTVSYVSVDGKSIGFIVISDSIKSSSLPTLQMLMDEGIDVIMMTGDNEQTAKNNSRTASIEEFQG